MLGWVPSESAAVNKHIAWYTSPYLWSRSVCWCLAGGQLAEISADVWESATMRYTITRLLYFTLPCLLVALDRRRSSARGTATLPHRSAWRTKQNVLISRRLNEPAMLGTAASRLPQLVGRNKGRRHAWLVSTVMVGHSGRRSDAMHHRRWRTIVVSCSSHCGSSRCFSLGPNNGFMTWYPAVLSASAQIRLTQSSTSNLIHTTIPHLYIARSLVWLCGKHWPPLT